MAAAPELLRVPLFGSAHAGFGDSRQVAPNRYNRILYGFDPRFPGELRFGHLMDNQTITDVDNTSDGPPPWAAEWRNNADAYPVLLFLNGINVREVQFGSQGTRGTALAQRTTDACFHDNGSGIQRLIIAQGSAGNIVSQLLDDTRDTITGTIQRDKVASVSGAIYGSAIPASGTRFSGISFCPYGSAPTTAANWSSVTRVGWASTDINRIVSVRGVPCVLKPEGIFLYNRGKDQWENMMPGWESEPHPDNGRAAVSRGPDAVISRGRGGLVIFDGYSVRDISPYIDAVPDEDTTQQKISALAVWHDQILAVTSVCQTLRGGAGNKEAHGFGISGDYNAKLLQVGNDVTEGVRFWRTQDNETTFTDASAAAGDASPIVTITLDAQDTAANGDYFTIGYRYPWRAVALSFDATVSQRNTNTATLTAEYWNGSAWASMAIIDLTRGRPATGTVTLGRSGLVVLTGNPTDWTARTYGTAGTDTAAGYYYIRFSVSTALSATVRISDVKFLPWRPSIDTTDHPLDGLDRSGCLPHVLLGTVGEKGAVWHDMGSTRVVDEIGFVTSADVGGNGGVNARFPILTGLRRIIYWHYADVDTWPVIDPLGLAEFGFIRVAEGRPVRLKTIRVDGREFNGLTSMSFYYRYDSNERWSKVLLGARPPFVSKIKGAAGAGASFQWAIGYVMADTADPRIQRRPVVTGVTGEFELVAEREGMLAQRTIASPPRG